MKKTLLISGLFLTISLLNGCANQSRQPDVQSNFVLKTKVAAEPIKQDQNEIDKLNATFKDYPKILSQPLPYYPAKALSERTVGELKVKFDVDENGYVQNIRMLDTSSVDVFGLSLINAMKQWRYESGKPTKDLNLLVEFSLD